MGFGGFFKKAFRNPVRTLTAISTFGSSELARAVVPKKIQAPLIRAIGAGASLITANPAPTLAAEAFLKSDRSFRAPTVIAPVLRAQPQGVTPMGLNVGGILGQVGTIFGGGQNSVFSGISNVANLASQFFPPRGINTGSSVRAVIQPVSAAMPMLRGGAMVARGFFNKFPNLALAIQQLRARGMTVKRAQLWSMLKRFGPEVLITGGVLTAAAVNELMMAGPGHRRMNPGNAKALRRSLRRIESFHRLCVRADRFRGSRRRSAKTCKGGSPQFVRQG